MRTVSFLLATVLLVVFPVAAQPTFLAGFGAAFASGDFDGDGFPDLAVGASSYAVNGMRAGAVDVLYGTAAGLSATDNQRWTQDSPGIDDQAENFDFFGFALAAGDFDGDGFADLAIGAYGEDLEGPHPTFIRRDVGAVHILYGSPDGLTATRSQFAHQDTPGVRGAAQFGDGFGRALASGDFDGDGRDDLAVGVPQNPLGPIQGAGEGNVFYGSASGLRVARNQLWSQDSPGVEGEAERNDEFGGALAAGDFDGDGRDDLAIGVSHDDVLALNSAGAVNVLYGSGSGLSADRNQLWTQDSPDVLDTAEGSDYFGFALAVRDFDGDGWDDLAVGVPRESVFGVDLAGAVNVLYGSASGLSADGNQLWHQDSPGVLDEIEANDQFGHALASGDFDGDGHDDLVVGLPDEDFGSVSNAGAVNVLYGSGAGLTATGNQFWHQELDGLPDLLEDDDHFGGALGTGDFDSDGFADLAIGVSGQDIQGVQNAGAVNVLYGTGAGLSAVGNQYWHQGLLLPLHVPDAEVAARGIEVSASVAGVSVWPNPASGTASVAFALPEAAEVRLALYDVLGRAVADVAPGPLEAGPHRLALDVSVLPPGVYVWRLRTGTRVESGRLTVVR